MMRTTYILLLLLAGCATVNQPESGSGDTIDVESKASLDKGEAIYATSLAIRLAELALQKEGYDPKNRGVMVSYCDGIYTVTFEKPEYNADANEYKVDIDAGTSRIIRVLAVK